jgi:hypothetical protein
MARRVGKLGPDEKGEDSGHNDKGDIEIEIEVEIAERRGAS